MDTANNSTTLSRQWLEFMNRSTATIAIETSILLLIGLIAIGGNLLVIISIYRNPSLRTITNYFVLSLAMTDILYQILGLPLTLAWSIKSRFIFGQETCDYQANVSTSFIYVSITTMILMAVNRFVCVCKHEKYKKLFNKKTSFLMIGLVWFISFTGVPLYNEVGVNQAKASFLPKHIRCGYLINQKTTSKILVNLTIAVSLFIPFTIIVYCYYKVFKKIREHKRNIAPSSNQRGLGTSVHEVKATWTMFAVLLGYCVTWIPVLLITLMSNIFSSWFIPRQVHLIVTYAGVSSCVINPIIYGVTNVPFRQEYKNIFGCS